MTRSGAALIAVDGVHGEALVDRTRALAASAAGQAVGISYWDASGLFGEVAVTEEIAGRPSARTLLLLYASDLAFRLRWEVRPALEIGRSMVVAPYVDTAIAFGRAAGIDTTWIADTFSFAPAPATRQYVALPGTSISQRKGFVEFSCHQIVPEESSHDLLKMIRLTDRHLRAIGRRGATAAPR